MTGAALRGSAASLFSSLRFRVLAALTMLGVIPFALATTLLFRTVRANVESRAGEALAMDAHFLASEIEGEFLRRALASGVSPDSPELLAESARTAALAHLAHFKVDSATVGMLLAGNRLIASSRPGSEVLPRTIVTAAPWFPFRAVQTWYGAAAPVGDGMGAGLTVLVVSPQSAVLADFDTLVRYTAVISAALAAVLLTLSWRLAGRLLKPIGEMRHGAEIISKINLSHRIEVRTGDELELLAGDFNQMAQALEDAYGALEARVEKAVSDLAQERNRLAATLSTMVEGVVVTNDQGETVLLNPAGRAALLNGPGSGVGLPLCALLPSERLEFHRKRLLAFRETGRDAVEEVIFHPSSGRILRGAMTTFADHTGRIGYLLVLRDVTEEARREERTLNLLATMPARIKDPLSSLQAGIEILTRRRDLDQERRGKFLAALAEDATRLERAVADAEENLPEVRYLAWPISSADPVALARSALAAEEGVRAAFSAPEGPLEMIAVEPFGWLLVLRAPLRWLGARAKAGGRVEVKIERAEDAATFVYLLDDAPRMELSELDSMNISPASEAPLTMREAVRQNRAGLWMKRTPRGLEVRIAAPLATGPAGGPLRSGAGEKTGFYDFALLEARPAPGEESLYATALDHLELVVLDTEATGLDVEGGDRLLSLSAVRIKGGRLIESDLFDTLVDPKVPIPPSSTRIHGITEAALAGAPSPGDALARFAAWAGKAALVCHDAGFDTGLLAAEASRAGRTLPRRPVLDTLALSAHLHPGAQGHTLEAISARLGVEMGQRHTSLGDAMTTARIFVNLLPLLRDRGVVTLSEALDIHRRPPPGLPRA